MKKTELELEEKSDEELDLELKEVLDKFDNPGNPNSSSNEDDNNEPYNYEKIIKLKKGTSSEKPGNGLDINNPWRTLSKVDLNETIKSVNRH